MEPGLERVLRGLQETAERMKDFRFEVSDEYRSLLLRLEAHPMNQSGSDKTAVFQGQRAYKKSFHDVRLLTDNP
ncbi:MAG: hypothetical protein FJW14_00770 [Acidimicrobiia bacterium]|nr:hypothetical protein [Acidimicrobiia bacterium]